jgi:hypothetical protein
MDQGPVVGLNLQRRIRRLQGVPLTDEWHRQVTNADTDRSWRLGQWQQGTRTGRRGLPGRAGRDPEGTRRDRATARGWQLDQPKPRTMAWVTPSGRSYATGPAAYPG